MKISKIIRIILPAFSLLLLIIFLGWHLKLGLVRYFDVDEYAYLHWAYQVFQGQKPYIDFFLYVPPGFQWFLVPLFLLGKGVTPLIAGRVVSFLVFAGDVLAISLLFWQVRRSWIAILAGTLLAFLPLPFDKFLEIRPDNLAALLVLLGVIWQIKWMRKLLAIDGFLAGLFYALSLIVLPKSIPALAVAVLIGTAYFLNLKKEKQSKIYLPVLAGFIGPLVLFGLWLLTLGNLPLAVYSIVKLPFEVNKISQFFYMAPDLFFYPNQIFYGVGGWSQGLIVNALIWIIAILVGTTRLFTPSLANNREEKTSAYEEILIAGMFTTQVIYYVMWSPLKHTQYLIPIAFFVSFYAADCIYLIWEKVKGAWGKEFFFTVVFIISGFFLYQTNQLVEAPKLAMTNVNEFATMNKLWATIPASEYLLDLDGSTLYYRNPYYICCLPFGQHRPFISRQFPLLIPALEQTQTKFIWQGGLERVQTLTSEDQAYIGNHFRQSDIPGLLVRN